MSVIIPVFNEARTILKIIKKVEGAPFDKEIIVVDDASTDGTREMLQQHEGGIKVLYHEVNQGKGAAIRTVLPHLTGDIVIIQDADLEYDPSEYPHLIKPILEGKADVVYGSRFLRRTDRVLLFWHAVGNKIVTTLSNLLGNLNLTDMETGYKVFRAGVFKKIKIETNRFGFEPEITAKVTKMGCRIHEVPISYRRRNYSEGKKIDWKDGLAAIYWIIRFRLF